jgi:hypothetical protein
VKQKVDEARGYKQVKCRCKMHFFSNPDLSM